MLNPTHLEFFLHVAETGSFRSAAKYCMVSQSAVSQAVKKLESVLDVSLVDRTNHSIRLTPDGHELLEYIQSQKKDYEALLSRFRRLKKRSRPLRVGINRTYEHRFIPFICDFTLKYPEHKVDYTIDSGAEIRSLFKDKKLDLIITVNISDAESSSYLSHGESSLLFEDRIIAVSRKEHPISKIKNPSREDMVSYPLFLPSGKRELLEAYFLNYGLMPNIPLCFNHSDCIPELLSKSDAISIISEKSFPISVFQELHKIPFAPFESEFLVVVRYQDESKHTPKAFYPFNDELIRRKKEIAIR